MFCQVIYHDAAYDVYQDQAMELCWEGAHELATLSFLSPKANEVHFVWLNFIAYPICFQKLIERGFDPEPYELLPLLISIFHGTVSLLPPHIVYGLLSS